jgi:hypothetical protein
VITTLVHRTRKGISLATSLVILSLSVGIPMLERADLTNTPVAESTHSPVDCPRGHDHTVCTQVGANLSIVVAGHAIPLAAPEFAAAPPTLGLETAAAGFDPGHRSRAPPHA